MTTTIKSTLHFVFFSAIILESCNPQEEGEPNLIYLGNRTKIEGKVLEYGTNLPWPGVMLIIVEERYTGGIFGGGSTEDNIDTIYSNLDGSYSYEFKHCPPEYGSTYETDVGYSYHMESYLANYFRPIDAEIATTYWNKNRNIILDPYARIKVHIKNVNPFHENDIFSVTASRGGGGQDLLGTKIDTLIIMPDFGNRKTNICRHLWRNKNYTRNCDSLYLVGFDTVSIEILY